MTRAELEALIDSGDAEACITAFEGMPEAERTKLAAAAAARLRELGKATRQRIGRISIAEDFEHAVRPFVAPDPVQTARLRAARSAVLATGSLRQCKSVGSGNLPSNERLFRILSDRRPEWLDEFVEYICDEEDDATPRWPLIRQFVRQGLCGPPRSARYIDRMLRALNFEAERAKPGWKVVPSEREQKKSVPVRISLKDVLLADPGLLDHEIWRIFDTEPGPGAVQLFTADPKRSERDLSWDGALTDLAKEGRISRERLLGATLDGLSRDMNETRAKWFARLHDRLEPTMEERAARAGLYVDLLGSRNASTIGFALGVIKDLVKAATVAPVTFIDRVAGAMTSRTKGIVKAALTVLQLAVRSTSDPGVKARVLAVATEGLVHDAADIQNAILDFLERNGDRNDRSLCELLRARRDGIAASLRSRLDAWLNLGAEPEHESVDDQHDPANLVLRATALDPRLAALADVAESLEVVRGQRSDCPVLKFDGTEIPRLDPARRLEPIDDLDRLIELCLRLIEDPRPPDDIDRCVDAISRLCDQRPADFEKRTAPLSARIRQQLGGRLEVPAYLLSNFAVIVRSWLTQAVPEPLPFDRYRGIPIFLSAATCALARRIARRQAAPWLAALTHAGGWIDPRTLVERLHQHARLQLAADPGELVMAILRIAPDQRADALANARDLPGESGAAIRYALGSDDESVGPKAAFWVAAARARAPWSDDAAVEARHSGLGPDAGRAAAYHVDGNEMVALVANVVTLRIGRQPAVPTPEPALRDLPTVWLHAQEYLSSDHWPTPASLWPGALESCCACGARQLVMSIEESSDWQGLRGFLLPLLDPDVPLRPMARLLLAVALNAKLPETAGLATDVLVAAIDDGRLDGETLGSSLRTVWQMRVESWIYRAPNDPLFGQQHTVAFVKPTRWAKALGDVARSSPVHARVIARAIELFLADEASNSRSAASLLPFLEILRETSVETGRAISAETRAFLGRLGTAGKTGRVVKELLALRDLPDSPAMRAARMQVLARRIERAERWMAWERAAD
jgi:hypothetical protein